MARNPNKKSTQEPLSHQPRYRPASAHILANEDDLERIDSLISILGLAVGEILRARIIREPPEETPCEDDFNAQIQNALDEADQQMNFPWYSYEI